jgi:hypothetical protein
MLLLGRSISHWTEQAQRYIPGEATGRYISFRQYATLSDAPTKRQPPTQAVAALVQPRAEFMANYTPAKQQPSTQAEAAQIRTYGFLVGIAVSVN